MVAWQLLPYRVLPEYVACGEVQRDPSVVRLLGQCSNAGFGGETAGSAEEHVGSVNLFLGQQIVVTHASHVAPQ